LRHYIGLGLGVYTFPHAGGTPYAKRLLPALECNVNYILRVSPAKISRAFSSFIDFHSIVVVVDFSRTVFGSNLHARLDRTSDHRTQPAYTFGCVFIILLSH
jgi:hypothetical protein